MQAVWKAGVPRRPTARNALPRAFARSRQMCLCGWRAGGLLELRVRAEVLNRVRDDTGATWQARWDRIWTRGRRKTRPPCRKFGLCAWLCWSNLALQVAIQRTRQVHRLRSVSGALDCARRGTGATWRLPLCLDLGCMSTRVRWLTAVGRELLPMMKPGASSRGDMLLSTSFFRLIKQTQGLNCCGSGLVRSTWPTWPRADQLPVALGW